MKRLLTIALIVFLIGTAYIFAFATPSIFYMSNVLLHVGLGIALGLAGAVFLWRNKSLRSRFKHSTWLLFVGAGLGIYLMVAGNTTAQYRALWAHIGVCVLGLLFFSPRVRMATIALALVAFGVRTYNESRFESKHRIANSLFIPTSMQEEGGGPQSPFWPSASKTNVGGTIPSNFFMDSELCGSCHKDAYEQWNGSMHHFASFNNQFYRKSIEHMQAIQGTQGSKWCAGCHDHAVFFNGRFDKPIKDQIDTPEAQNGLGCVSCHSITHVDGTAGNGGFTIEYPPLHDLASSKNYFVRKLDYFLTYLDPEPHRKTFMKPFMRKDASEFCSTCHKVHLDVPVNNYRWLRGFNDYDNWQASGVSGQGARSFYYPKEPSNCSDCHMPKVKSSDPGNRDGMIHSHRFAAANMAVAYVNQDQKQMDETEKFLKSGFISVDIFAVTPVEDTKGALQMRRRAGEAPKLSSTMAVGEESEQSGPIYIREVGRVAAPIDTAQAKIEPGSTVRLDVVTRTRKIGHFFPGGTVDSFDIWIEVKGVDAEGKTVFWSGAVDDDGKGSVEKGAHFYRSYMLDGEGNMVSKRNAWQARSVLYVRLIPPGAADVSHYRFTVPKNATGPITFTAKLHYRKFSHYFTQYVYAGEPKAGQDEKLVALDHDSREYSFENTNIPKNVSGKIKDRIPDIPIVTLAETSTQIALGKPEWQPKVAMKDRERWNDWGIGLLLQGDLKGAEYAFLKVTEAEPGYADGWLNVARALIQEGETDAAKPYIAKALAIDAKLGRIHYFKALIEKADGDYDAALKSLRTVSAMYPRDRVVLNQMGRILFLKREFAQAVAALERVLAVDTEDVQAHYNLMLSYRGLGDTARAEREEKLFRRFKADESAQAITAKPRLLSPEDNNARQPIHDHETIPLANPRSPRGLEPAGRGAPVTRAVSGRDGAIGN